MTALAIGSTTGVLQERRPFEPLDVDILKDMQVWRDTFASASTTEVSAALVATAYAAKQLKRMRLADQPFPDNLLHGRCVVGGAEATARLARYVTEVNRLRVMAEDSANRLNRLAAPGLEILVLSLHAVSGSRRLLREGQVLWHELMRGVAGYPTVYRTLVNPAATAAEIADDLFLPAALIRLHRRGTG
jgi:hypothetical protein